MAKKTLMENIEERIANDDKYITIDDRLGRFKIKVNENVDVTDIHSAIMTIADEVENQNFAYTLIDLIEAYYIIELFTDIPVPTIKYDDGVEVPDYQKCYVISTKLQLKDRLFGTSLIVGSYIELLEKNVWRILEYKKARLTLLPYESMMDALNEFYEMMDDLGKYVENQKDIDVEALAKQIGDVATKLSIVDDLKAKEATEKQ